MSRNKGKGAQQYGGRDAAQEAQQMIDEINRQHRYADDQPGQPVAEVIFLKDYRSSKPQGDRYQSPVRSFVAPPESYAESEARMNMLCSLLGLAYKFGQYDFNLEETGELEGNFPPVNKHAAQERRVNEVMLRESFERCPSRYAGHLEAVIELAEQWSNTGAAFWRAAKGAFLSWRKSKHAWEKAAEGEPPDDIVNTG